MSVGCAGFRACGPEDDAWGADKRKHFVASALIGAGATAVAAQRNDTGDAAAMGFSVALAAGLAKEGYDLYGKQTCWSWKDLVWDVLGASVGVSLAAWATD
ncbi:MAG TPA: hypothetical protein PKA51_09005 [Kiritimatiellia bacterium]|nr:hypothetical protein [Kiritimatiellia bacterium]